MPDAERAPRGRVPSLRAAGLLMACTAACQVNLPATRWGGTPAGQDARPGDVSDDPRRDVQDGGSCRQSVVDLTVPNGSVVLLAERSSVMNTANDSTCAACGSYWTALVAAADTLTSATSNHFRWGLKLFPSPSDTDACLVSSTVEVPLATQARASILSTLAACPTPSGGTPTTSAVGQVYDYFATIQDGTPKIVLLAMGGTPTCAAGDPTHEDLQAATAKVGDLSGPIVFVLGIGANRQKLDRMAVAGSMANAYSTDQLGDLLGAIEGWARMMGSCQFPLPAPAPAGQSVSVSLDNTQLSQGGQDGFTVSRDGTQMTIQGAPCFYIGTYATLTIRVGCGG